MQDLSDSVKNRLGSDSFWEERKEMRWHFWSVCWHACGELGVLAQVAAITYGWWNSSFVRKIPNFLNKTTPNFPVWIKSIMGNIQDIWWKIGDTYHQNWGCQDSYGDCWGTGRVFSSAALPVQSVVVEMVGKIVKEFYHKCFTTDQLHNRLSCSFRLTPMTES